MRCGLVGIPSVRLDIVRLMSSWRRLFSESNELLVVAAGVTIALAAYALIQAVVSYLLTPLITVFVGEFPLELNQFTIDGSEFRYGQVLSAAIVLVVVLVLVHYLVPAYRRYWGREDDDGEKRS